MSRLDLLGCLAAILVVAVAAACGSQDDSSLAVDSVVSASTIGTEAESTAPSLAPPTPEGATTSPAPSESVPLASVPEVSVPSTEVPAASVPEVSVPLASVPDVSVPDAAVSDVSVPDAAVSDVSVPLAAVPDVSVPDVAVPSVELSVAAEHGAGYHRDDWGSHNSSLCRGAVGSADPYTGTLIDTCNVDHVVALHEAHESGGWSWSAAQKRLFSQAPENLVASRACVNQSKGGDDIFEWSDADIASSSACGSGYMVTPAGRCFLARTTVAVKSAWSLSVDQAEADALTRTLRGCGDPGPELSAMSQDAGQAAAPTTIAAAGECVIAGKTAAQYDAVSGIGEVLSARLADAQPFSSRSQLEAVRGIGPAKSEAVWSYFCGP